MNSQKNSKDSKKRKKLFYNFWYDFVKVTGALPALIYLRPKIYRPYGTKTPKGGVLVTANHRSMFDPVIMHVVFPERRLDCLATKDLFNTKVKHFFFNKMHCIMVDKENFTLSAFHDVVARLKDDKLVVIFPEGGLNTDAEDTIRAFKSGAVLMAHKAKSPILPVYIVKRDKWYQRQHVVIGKPYNVCEGLGVMPTMDQLNEASEAVRAMELELREYYESKQNKKTKNLDTNINSTQGDLKDEQKV